MADNKVKFLRGTSAEYKASTKDKDTFYYTTDDGKLYLGNKEIAGAGVTEEQLVDAFAEHNTDENAHSALFQGGKTVEKASAYSIDNAVDYPIVDLRLYGKSTQDGVPSPENPVEIVSVGDSGAVGVTACGKNMCEGSQDWSGDWDINSLWENDTETYLGLPVKKAKHTWSGIRKKIYVEKGKTYTFSCYAKSDVNVRGGIFIVTNHNNDPSFASPDKENSFTIGTEWARYKLSYTCEKSGYIMPRIEKRVSGDNYVYVCGYQLEVGDTATSYEPYVGSTANLTSALPLCGIPVEADGNYTDSNGQQWICDELIYNADGTGKIVKNTMSMLLDGSDDEEYIKDNTTEVYVTLSVLKSLGNNLPIKYTENMMCNNTIIMSWKKETVNDFGLNCGNHLNIMFGLNMGITTVEAVKTWLSAHPTTIIYPLRTPQEIPLTAEEMSQLQSLQTFNGVTNISNDKGAEMRVKYCTNRALSEYGKPLIDSLKNKIDISKPTSFTLATSSWSELSETIGEYAYSADIVDANLADNDSVDVRFSVDSISICEAAKVASAGTVSDGKITLYAKSVPTESINGVYIIAKGV